MLSVGGMNLRTLRYLVALAQTRHFGRAAQQCCVSQPTLSAQIKKLETQLGVALVERRHKNVLLTEVGEQVVERARRMLYEADEIAVLARHHQDPLAGRLGLGFIPTLGPYLLPHIVPELVHALRELNFYFAEYQTEPLVQKLASGELDAGFLALPHGQAEPVPLEHRVLFEEHFVVAMPRGHALAAHQRVRIEQLDPDELLLLQDGHCLRDQALSVCGLEDDLARRTLAATSLETLRQMVAAGQGVTLLPELAVGDDDDAGPIITRRFVDPQPVRQIAALWRRSTARRQAIEAVCNCIESALQEKMRAR